jgi:hypothetical protein
MLELTDPKTKNDGYTKTKKRKNIDKMQNFGARTSGKHVKRQGLLMKAGRASRTKHMVTVYRLLLFVQLNLILV